MPSILTAKVTILQQLEMVSDMFYLVTNKSLFTSRDPSYNCGLFPSHTINNLFVFIPSGSCSGWYNTKECGYDGGECLEFNAKFPDCRTVGGGDCESFNATYPGCLVEVPESLGNGLCAGGSYNTEECAWDGGDCIEFNRKYPKCDVDFPFLIGDGKCSDWMSGAMTGECGWDGNDCL